MRSVLVLCMLVLLPAFSAAQEPRWEMSSIAVTTGEGVLSSGFNADITFRKGNRKFEVAGDDGQGWALYSVDVGRFSLGGTAGILLNTPLVGPKIDYRMFGWLTFMTWPAASIGRRFGEPGFDLNLGVVPGFIFLNVKSLSLSYAAIKFERNPLWHIPGGAYTFKIDPEKSLLFGVDYNTTDDDVLWRMAYIWSPARKDSDASLVSGK